MASPPPPHLQVLRTAEKQTPDSLGGSDSPEGRFPERKPMMCLDSEASCQVSSFSAHFKVSSVQRNFQGGSCYFRAEKSDFPLFVPPSSPPGSWAIEDCVASLNKTAVLSLPRPPPNQSCFLSAKGEEKEKKIGPWHDSFTLRHEIWLPVF